MPNLRTNLNLRNNLDEQERNLIMKLTPLYTKWREEGILEGKQEGILEGKQEGILEGKQESIENILKAKFGTLDENLSSLIQPLSELPSEEMARLMMNLSREYLLKNFARE